jgi:hypothetical protein
VPRSCSDNLTFTKSEAAFELAWVEASRRVRPATKALTFNSLMGTRQAVPTGEAHRLPKSAAYVSTLSP